MAMVLRGTVAPMAPGAEGDVFEGQVWLGDDGLVAAVTRGGEAGPAGFESAHRVDVGDGVVHPGFVDLHSHLGYNFLPLWAQPQEKKAFLHHDIWPGRSTYKPDISWPAWTLMDLAPESLFAYLQTRAVAGGTTTIQGWPSASRPPVNRLVRSVDDDQVGALVDPVVVSTLTLDAEGLRTKADALGAGRSFVYHCGEGQRGSIAAREFDALTGRGWSCLSPGLIAIHCCSLDADRFAAWRAAAAPAPGETAGTVVWSPFSNLWLYGETTLVPDALANDVGVALGTDWGPSGTKNLLGEIKVARLWSDRQGWGLTDLQLARMVTCVPGDALARAWGRPVGRLVPGAVADVVVLARATEDVWANLVGATDTAVSLTVVAGVPRFGTPALMTAAGATMTSAVPVRGKARRVTLARPDDPTEGWTWKDVLARLDAVRAHVAEHPPTGPAGRRGAAAGAGAATTPPEVGDPPGTPPIAVRLDMPGGPTGTAGPPPAGQKVDIPPLEPLHHDPAWLASIPGRGFHAGALDGLRAFYR
jgi:5-methylthioadenosine/S-adenosylhomocysteine deaminase